MRDEIAELGMEDEFFDWMREKIGTPENLHRVKSGLLYPPMRILKGDTQRGRIFEKIAWAKHTPSGVAQYGHLRSLAPHTGNKFLHELRAAGLVDKPRRGEYQITKKGEKAFEKMTDTGVWINPEMLVKPQRRYPEPEMRREVVERYYSPEHMIREDTDKAVIVHILKARGKMRFSDLSKNIDPQNLGMYLKRMELADIVDRAGRGIYRLTDKGKRVQRELERKGIWRA